MNWIVTKRYNIKKSIKRHSINKPQWTRPIRCAVCHLLQCRKKWKFLGFGLWRQVYFRVPTAHRNHSFCDQIWYFLDYLFITGKIRRDSSIVSLDIITRCHCMTLSIMAWNLKRYIWWWDFDTDFHYYFFDTPMVTSLLDHWYIVFYDFCVFLEFGSILVFSLKNLLLGFAALTIEIITNW